MRIAIVNGNPDPNNQKLDDYLDSVIRLLESADNSVAYFTLREIKIDPCRGCFACWLKPPVGASSRTILTIFAGSI